MKLKHLSLVLTKDSGHYL